MRLGFGVLVGLLLVLAGASIILSVLFKIDIPLVRTAFALLLIYFGLTMLLGVFGVRPPWSPPPKNMVAFSRGELHPSSTDEPRELNVIFGSGVIDLTGVQPTTTDIHVKTNVVFGEGIVRVDPGVPLRVRGSAAFADLRFPDGHQVAFGQLTYETPAYAKTKPCIVVDASTVFGSLRFEAQQVAKE